MTSETTPHKILPDTSKSKVNHTIKFGQLIEYNVRNVFLQKPCWKWGREISFLRLFLFFKKTSCKVEKSG